MKTVQDYLDLGLVFQDGATYGSDSILSIDAYHDKTGQAFEMVVCK